MRRLPSAASAAALHPVAAAKRGAMLACLPLAPTCGMPSRAPPLTRCGRCAAACPRRSFPDDYPGEELSLKLTDAANLAEPAVRQLSKLLHQAAAQYAAEGEVCCFQLVTLAQEFLQQHNCPPEEEDEEAGPAAPLSLWHELQQVGRRQVVGCGGSAVQGRGV